MLNDLAGCRALVTGGTGFLGRHLLPLLLARGVETRVLSRSPSAPLPAGVIRVAGDCLDRECVIKAAQDADLIIHMAGLLFGADWNAYLRANYGMAQNIAAAARGQKIIYISSLAAAGPSPLPKKESDPARPVSAYGWSKLLAEQALASAQGELIILRPPIIYGSGDRGLLPLFRSVRRGIGITSGNFPLSLIHADDCSRAIVALCEGGAMGVYHLSDGEIHTLGDICRAMAAAQGRKKLFVARAPKILLKAAAHLSTSWHGLASAASRACHLPEPRPPSWNTDKLREALQAGWVADNSKIREDTGFMPQTALATGMQEAVAGYIKDGWL